MIPWSAVILCDMDRPGACLSDQPTEESIHLPLHWKLNPAPEWTPWGVTRFANTSRPTNHLSPLRLCGRPRFAPASGNTVVPFTFGRLEGARFATSSRNATLSCANINAGCMASPPAFRPSPRCREFAVGEADHQRASACLGSGGAAGKTPTIPRGPGSFEPLKRSPGFEAPAT